MAAGLSAQRVYQDLISEHGFRGGYSSVKLFVRRLTATAELPFRRMEYDPGAGAWVVAEGKRRRPHLFRAVLSHSRKGYSEVVWRQDTETLDSLFGKRVPRVGWRHRYLGPGQSEGRQTSKRPLEDWGKLLQDVPPPARSSIASSITPPLSPSPAKATASKTPPASNPRPRNHETCLSFGRRTGLTLRDSPARRPARPLPSLVA